MRLGAWMEKKGLSHRDLARRLGCDHSAVTRWVKGRMPKQKWLLAIEQATDGEVTANDFLPSRDDVSVECVAAE